VWKQRGRVIQEFEEYRGDLLCGDRAELAAQNLRSVASRSDPHVASWGKARPRRAISREAADLREQLNRIKA
jgi:hypothetical protein